MDKLQHSRVPCMGTGVGTASLQVLCLLYRGKNVMLDCGIHPGFSGLNSLPYLVSNPCIGRPALPAFAAVPSFLQVSSSLGKILSCVCVKWVLVVLGRGIVCQGIKVSAHRGSIVLNSGLCILEWARWEGRP